ncbi:hypothetical protein BJ123_1305 [Rhodopseudomonas thermotolerans]|uniref:Uncharacterized protein n=2 Tax=Rhodopseudomonas TaxID=1073 RepID=A0A336JU14_9BRAD|nr:MULTISPECIES: hypothetical protein [Rhodopseudomonas]RED25772.1 hypothetical protein BJ125_1305 [Rhodopseudomonas pentothenatexigens]REF90401.1 hypothetical protein BJ123_1305 [Rhodopseudomonas thermotolerans]SSW93100.1 hypothetical protein SAMN05892882_1305 [Rhodopseudomonas pentothenatexigens]
MSSYQSTRQNERYSRPVSVTSQPDNAGGRLRRPASADECFDAMARHHERVRMDGALKSAPAPAPIHETAKGAVVKPDNGDILYGAKAIALFIFGNDDNRSRRRVFNLWAHYRDRKEAAGFLKLNGAVCLSKSQWRAFHGLG